MGLFKEIHCAHCGEKVKRSTRMELLGGQYLCAKCSSVIPPVMMRTVYKDYGIEEYHALLEYIEYSNKYLRPSFSETHSFYTIHIDTEHNILYFGGRGVDEKTVFFNFHNLEDFDLVFSAEEFKEGMLGNKVIGKILLMVKMDMPYFYYETILDSYVTVDAKKKFFSSTIEYENPRGMDEFIIFFQTAWQKSLEEALRTHCDNSHEVDYQTNPSDLQQAMTLFMLDSLENVTVDEIKAQRNRLIKAFHPDKGVAEDALYAQKINAAYEVLKQYLS